MNRKLTKAIALIITLFASGGLLTFIGLFKGHDIAITLSRPAGATGWSTSQEFITSCTYFPIIMGAALMVLSMLLAAVLFSHWLGKSI